MIAKFILFLPYLLAISALENHPKVKTPLGLVQGRYSKSYGGRAVSAFEGIPYALPPVEKLRFKEPQPPQRWTGTLIANTTYVCIQYVPIAMTDGIMGTEDCLYIYIYVPKVNITGEENLDVVVAIHGGAFMLGAPNYMAGPNYIVDRDVVFVSFNYRVGIFGFLCTEDDVISGNNGLKDQVMALKWIQDNIKYFGGNPDSVTITGLSAGGASVHYHYLSPMSKGLFHRGFSQSGTALNTWALTERPLEKAQKLAMHLNCSREWSQEILDCLQEKPSDQIIKTLKKFFVFINAIPYTPFGPVIEKGPNAFLPEHPYKLLQQGQINDCPWICSNTKNEGIYPVGFFVLYGKLQELDQNWNEIIPMALDFKDTTTEVNKKIVTMKVRERYMNNESISMENLNKLIDLFTDRGFLVDTETAVRLQAKVSKSPVHYYMFNYKLQMNTLFPKEVTGVAHSDDGRLFIHIYGNPAVFSDKDEKMKNMFMDFIYNFAKNGTARFNGVDWTPVGMGKNISYMHITAPDDIKMNQVKEFAPTAFWDSLPIEENQHLCKID